MLIRFLQNLASAKYFTKERGYLVLGELAYKLYKNLFVKLLWSCLVDFCISILQILQITLSYLKTTQLRRWKAAVKTPKI